MRKCHSLFHINQNASELHATVYAGIRSQDLQTNTRRRPVDWMGCLSLIFWSLCLPGWVVAADLTVFGPEAFIRNSGSPVVETRTFNIANVTQPHTLYIANGGLQNDGTTAGQVSSSEIFLNGVLVAGPSNFNQNVSTLSVLVTVQSLNTLTVELRGKPGGQITLRIERDANQIPLAAAGPDQTAFVSDTVQLDGAGSTDTDGDPLSYLWQLVLAPQGSKAVLSNTTAINPTLDCTGSPSRTKSADLENRPHTKDTGVAATLKMLC